MDTRESFATQRELLNQVERRNGLPLAAVSVGLGVAQIVSLCWADGNRARGTRLAVAGAISEASIRIAVATGQRDWCGGQVIASPVKDRPAEGSPAAQPLPRAALYPRGVSSRSLGTTDLPRPPPGFVEAPSDSSPPPFGSPLAGSLR